MKTPTRSCTLKKTVSTPSPPKNSTSSKPSPAKDSASGKPMGKGSMTNVPKPGRFHYPKQKTFCLSKEQFHSEHGLSLEGKLYQHLSQSDLPDSEWLTVFSRIRAKGSKIFVHMLRPEYVDECKLLFHKVYQGPPLNNEITYKFAILFAYERCQAAKEDPHSHQVAWAVFAEQVVENCKKQAGGIQKKMNSWNEMNGFETTFSHPQPSKGIKQEPDDVHSCHVLASDTRRNQIAVAYVKGMIERRAVKLDQLKSSHISKQGELQSRHESLLKIEGSSSAAAVLASELEKLKTKEQEMKEASNVDPECLKEVANRMSALSDALTLLGVGDAMVAIKSEVALLQDELSALEMEERAAMRQSTFCQNLLHKAEAGQLPVLLPVADVRVFEKDDIVNVPGFCTACGERLSGYGAVGVYTLPCGHKYHPICFAHWLGNEAECVDWFCEGKLTDSAQCWILRSDSETGNLEAAQATPQSRQNAAQATPQSKQNASASSLPYSTPANATNEVCEVECTTIQSDAKNRADDQNQPKSPSTNEVDHIEKVVLEGIGAVDSMMQEQDKLQSPESPIFLGDMLRISKKRKKNDDGGPRKDHLRRSESNAPADTSNNTAKGRDLATDVVQDMEAEPNPSTNSSADHLQIVDEEPTHIPPPKKN